MSRLPALRGKTHFRFSNPLTGQVYDNTKYQQFCFFEKEEENQQQQLSPSKSKSVVNCTLKKNTTSVDKSCLNSDTNSASLLSKQKVHFLEYRWLNPVKRCAKHCSKTSQTFNPQKTYSLEQSITREKTLNKNKIMKFSEIEVRVLQSAQKDQDIIGGQYSQKQFVIHLGRYFEMFFKNKLEGPLFQKLCIFVQRRIDQIIDWEDIGHIKQNSQQNYIIKNKISLYQKLVELEKIGNKESLKQMLLHYCLPPYQTRQIFLNDVMSMISHKLEERFNFDKNEKYVLLNEKGKIIKDFAQIKFSTKRLIVAVQSQLGAILLKNFNHKKNQKAIQQKFSFRQTLKNHFRNEVTKGLYEQNSNGNMSFRKQMSDKRLNLDKAERIINLKNQKHCQARKRIKRLIQISKNKNNTNNTSSQEIKRDPKEIIKFDKKILSTDERVMTEFKRFKRLNDYENAQFKNDESNINKVEFGIIAKESPYFKNKSQSQVQRIFSSLPFISPNESSPYAKKTITDQEYLNLRKIIACLVSRESIITFVDRYLCFDEYGQLQKQELKQTLLFVIGERNTSEVILLTIWSWLQKNGVIVNEAVSRGNMQNMYERNKIVYYFIISLIFGTNETTALDLAEDIM